MFLSKRIKYGMKALLYLYQKQNEVISAARLSKELNVPKEFISKIMQSLVYQGILKSKKGKGGGFYLAKTLDDINYEIILRVLGYEVKNDECLFDMSQMCAGKICPFCNQWKEFIYNFNYTIKNFSISGKMIE
ncbi:Rrf2 family transcriptional regulator [Rosettibacter firmus]|uniref:Rrf2 family transcriptional regulator n=1 Tax=Rosettibacter firmus TaxID=3111522 RepID=UPI00336BEC4C